MVTGNLLPIQPAELKFPIESGKQGSCCMQLTNETDKHVAFKVKTTNPRKYCVRPNTGVLLPGATWNVTVTMQAQKEASTDMQCRDKFLVQSVIVPDGASVKEVTPQMFIKEDGKVIEEFRLRVVYIPANPPSPILEESEEGSSTESASENMNKIMSISRATWSLISRLTEEKTLALQEVERLSQELDLLKKQIKKDGANSYLLLLAVAVGLLGILVGYSI